MLPPLFARPPADPTEERRIRRLAAARHAPASWLERARIITLSWDGAQVGQIAGQLGCHPRTVYRWLHRFNQGGIDGLADLPRSGRPRRLGELERGQIIALARSDPPGRLRRQPDGSLGLDQAGAEAEAAVAHWTLDALADAARAQGIIVGRSQVRRVLQAEGVRWRTVRSWSRSGDADFAPKERRSSPSTPPTGTDDRDLRRRARGRSFPAASHPRQAGRLMAIASRRHWSMGVVGRRPGGTAPCGSATARRSPWPLRPATRPATSSCWPRSSRPTRPGRSR
jgi:transposase